MGSAAEIGTHNPHVSDRASEGRRDRTHEVWRVGGRWPHDDAALDEIELYGELLAAAAEADGPLTLAQIDTVLLS